ncbi:MAG: hypothetical protein Q9160_004562 [Pyrenula sp. 1 TL-2023]
MANLSPVSATGMKRNSSQAGIEDPSAKRPRQTYRRFHTLKHQAALLPRESEVAFVNEEQAHEIFESSIAQIFNRVHDRHGEDELTEGPGAVELRVLPALREHAEECMAQNLFNLCSLVRQSMYACRRIQPLPIDLEYALKATATRIDSLLPELNEGHNERRPSLLPTPPPEDTDRASLSFLQDDDRSVAERKSLRYIPTTFPPFPSKHTYKHTSVYTDRERDPRRIRELATEEGRLGEQALRKLVGAVRTEAKLDLDEKGRPPDRAHGRSRKAETMESMFEKTMQAVMLSEAEARADRGEDDSLKLELAPVVNCDRKYWIPESMLKLKREAEKVAEKAAEKKREDLRTARQEKWAAEANAKHKISGTSKSTASKPHTTIKKPSQRSSSGPLKLKLKVKSQTTDASMSNA